MAVRFGSAYLLGTWIDSESEKSEENALCGSKHFRTDRNRFNYVF